VAWVIQLSRRPKLSRPFWIESTAIYRDATGRQRAFVRIAQAVPGCIAVYPDRGRRQGHAGIVVTVKASGEVDQMAHMSTSGLAVTNAAFMVARACIYCVLVEDLG
jgi:hypothetical protein